MLQTSPCHQRGDPPCSSLFEASFHILYPALAYVVLLFL
jgi:hypothetical protein